jgi:hypothetical protein
VEPMSPCRSVAMEVRMRSISNSFFWCRYMKEDAAMAAIARS